MAGLTSVDLQWAVPPLELGELRDGLHALGIGLLQGEVRLVPLRPVAELAAEASGGAAAASGEHARPAGIRTPQAAGGGGGRPAGFHGRGVRAQRCHPHVGVPLPYAGMSCRRGTWPRRGTLEVGGPAVVVRFPTTTNEELLRRKREPIF